MCARLRAGAFSCPDTGKERTTLCYHTHKHTSTNAQQNFPLFLMQGNGAAMDSKTAGVENLASDRSLARCVLFYAKVMQSRFSRGQRF
jgi:hypothetical protein